MSRYKSHTMDLETFTRLAYEHAVDAGAWVASDGDFMQWCKDFEDALSYCYHYGCESPETFWRGFC